MSKYGIKIRNYEAASVYEHYWGFRTYLDATDAMLVNSLFKDFLVENGLKIHKGESTRDIICLAFSYKTKGYEATKKRLQELDKPDLLENLERNKPHCKEISKSDLRTLAYRDGMSIRYKDETIHYKMLYRTPGKAKKGTCMFIRDELYDVAHRFLWMGIDLPEHNSPIVQMGAYSSLITSSIVGKIQIKPEQVLVLKDIESYMNARVITIETDKKKQCVARYKDDFKVSNVVFDGQALIDSSIFPSWGDGFVLLRSHMTKCAAFNTKIELFMRERFGAAYDTATVKDLWGRDVKVSDIKLICTESVMKWMTFKVSFDYWAEWVRKNDSMWGIVKTTHESKLGDVQRMSYQMVNALDIDSMPEVTAKSVAYIESMKRDNEVFLDYLRKNINFANDYDVLIALVEHNPQFVYSSYFRERKATIIENYVINFKSGRVIQNADNMTIVGSPYAMLLQAVGEDIENDPTFETENSAIQCWTEKFRDREYLAEFRSPFNSRDNMGYLHNVYHPYFDRYFSLGKLCIAVNMQHTDFQARNNGSDMDSDSIYTTNQLDIVAHAKRCVRDYPTIVNCIPKEKNIYDNTPEDFAKVDNRLAASQMAIGESSNLAQLALTYTYNFTDSKYNDYVSILSVIAQLAIDSAKRSFDVDIPREIARIKKDMEIEENGLPYFWQITKKDKMKVSNAEKQKARRKEYKQKIKERVNEELICPMNYMFLLRFTKYRNSVSTIPIKEFLVPYEIKSDKRKNRKIEQLIEKYMFDLNSVEIKVDGDGEVWYNNMLNVLEDKFDDLIADIRQSSISKNYKDFMLWLLYRTFRATPQTKNSMNQTNKNRSALIKVLYEVNPDVFLSCFKDADVFSVFIKPQSELISSA